ncbi:hypothetical protein GCM10023210_26980 [Chryseobacterium ginsengisoli]|uniref:Uncharacterized protein n=1 Tax=Chryseobacterium ginsengisoli TaxID=363853 RepID=A0ABP9MGQ1_9FLAO
MIFLFLSIINTLDSSFGVTEAKTERNNQRAFSNTNKGLFDRLNAYPWSFELKPPSLGVGLGIGYATSENGTITYELDGRLKANLIIGADVILDILALGSKFKPWGAIIDALDIVSWLANLFSGGSVEINYELYFQLTAKINLVGMDAVDGESKPATLTYNFADKKITKGGVALQGYLEGKLVASFGISLEIEMNKGKKFNGDVNKKADTKKAELSIGAEGKSYVALTLGKNFGNDNSWDADFYFSGLNLKIWAKFGLSGGEPEEFDIIPDAEGELDVLKGKFEMK